MNQIIEILMRRDGATRAEAEELLMIARSAVAAGGDPEDVLAEFFGLESDYVFDLL